MSALGLGVAPVHRTHRREARVVDQDLRGQAPGLELGEQPGSGSGVQQVGGYDVRGAPEPVGHGLQLVGRAGDQDQLVATTGELPGDLGSDALGSACDNGHTAWSGGRQSHIGTVRVSQAGDARVSTGGLLNPYRRVSENSDDNLVKNVRWISGSRGEHDVLLI